MTRTIADLFLKEIEAEEVATRKCVERVSATSNLFSWKPHDKSMQMGYLTIMMVDMLKWMAVMVETGEINFSTWEKVTEEDWPKLVEKYDENLGRIKKDLKDISDEDMEKKNFVLKNGEQVYMQDTLINSLSSTLNHWVHHRGQLTVYMRLNGILVPSLYGPSADEGGF